MRKSLSGICPTADTAAPEDATSAINDLYPGHHGDQADVLVQPSTLIRRSHHLLLRPIPSTRQSHGQQD
jgi:hypothetical protein